MNTAREATRCGCPDGTRVCAHLFQQQGTTVFETIQGRARLRVYGVTLRRAQHTGDRVVWAASLSARRWVKAHKAAEACPPGWSVGTIRVAGHGAG